MSNIYPADNSSETVYVPELLSLNSTCSCLPNPVKRNIPGKTHCARNINFPEEWNNGFNLL